MKPHEIKGQLVVGLRSVISCELETLMQAPNFMLADDYSFYAGNISEKKLNRMLKGSGRSLFAETFRLMEVILDNDFANNVDTIRPKIPEPF